MVRDVVYGWAVQVEVGLDFRGERMWVFLKEEDEGLGFPRGMVAVWQRRQEARQMLRRFRMRADMVGGSMRRRDGRVVRVRQVVEVVGDR